MLFVAEMDINSFGSGYERYLKFVKETFNFESKDLESYVQSRIIQSNQSCRQRRTCDLTLLNQYLLGIERICHQLT